ncbi:MULTISPECIES: hypothetical protein [Nostoc]|uniref:Uncharacterized protein n=1 Tax=Nostoc linckia FACHB-391 TaxID=2692906 RepID=A0ABR8ENB7_NOSLI|nr:MULTISPECIES: hypothetical protein [Nostoc]MBD2559430.1 hypothetical protein [Nostoc linckia FACHB-391]
MTRNTKYEIRLKTISFVRAQHCCAPTAWSIYDRRIIKKSLKQPILDNSHHDTFVQCVSPNNVAIADFPAHKYAE